MAELLALLFLVGMGYAVYRVVKYVKYRNELARARDRVLAGMENMAAARGDSDGDHGLPTHDDSSQVVMGTPIPSTLDGMSMKRCVECGAELPATAKFCGKCGAKLVEMQELPKPL